MLFLGWLQTIVSNTMIILLLVLSLLWCSCRYYILYVLTADHRQYPHNDDYQEFDHAKRLTINRTSSDRQYNGCKKRDNMTNNGLQNTTQKLNDWATRTLREKVDEVSCSGKVSNCFSPKGNRCITVLPLYSLSAIHYTISFQVKLLLCVTECRHIWEHKFCYAQEIEKVQDT